VLRAYLSLLSMLLLSAAGCGGGGSGDELPAVKGSVLGRGRTLASLNDPANPRPSLNDVIQVTGLRVSFVDNFDETGGGATGNIFLQDFTSPPGPYQGALAFKPSFSPPSFRTTIGDVVDVSGQYSEFQPNVDFLKKSRAGWTTPELSGSLSLRFDAPYVPLEPVEINPVDFLKYETGRPWLSMLVIAKNVKLNSDVVVPASGRSSADIFVGAGVSADINPTITNELFDLAAYAASVKAERGIDTLAGIELESVVGFVTLFDKFHIAPRNADDIKLK